MQAWTRGFHTTLAVAALAVTALAVLAANAALRANDPTRRTISLYNIHTKETLSVEYRRAGKHVPEAMKQINWLMRDWRRDETTEMDPRLIDLLWEIHAELGSREPIHVISAFRSRATNDMLRKTVGGQASESRHILGKAADVHFPDVPLKQIRYSALIRERGGVGYYPTSATPFVHIDTDAVRHWPRLPRYELALLFPNGATRHQPASGGPVTRDDYKVASARHQGLAQQVAEFFQLRAAPKGQQPGFAVADAGRLLPAAVVPQLASRLAALPQPALVSTGQPAPQLVSAPRLIERPSRFALPSAADRDRLTELFSLASLPQLKQAPQPAPRAPRPQYAIQTFHAPTLPVEPEDGWSSGWVIAPDYDDEHPEELSYRPFPVAPLLTATASVDDPVLAVLSHPEVARTLEHLDPTGVILPLRLRPGLAVARQLWAQEFRGHAINPVAFAELMREPVPSTLASRPVRTADGR